MKCHYSVHLATLHKVRPQQSGLRWLPSVRSGVALLKHTAQPLMYDWRRIRLLFLSVSSSMQPMSPLKYTKVIFHFLSYHFIVSVMKTSLIWLNNITSAQFRCHTGIICTSLIQHIINYYKKCKRLRGLMPCIPVNRTYLMVIFASIRTVTVTTIYNFNVQFLNTLIFLCLLPLSLPWVAVVAVRLYVGGPDRWGIREDYAVCVIYSDTCRLLCHYHCTY